LLRSPRLIALLLTLLVGSGACTAGEVGSAPQGTPGAPNAGLRFQLVATPYQLPAPVEREVAVGSGGVIYLAGGLDSQDNSVNGVFSLDPSTGRVTQVGTVPQPFHDAAGAIVDRRLLIFGGGSSVSTAAVQAFDLSSHRARVIGRLPKPLSDVSAATVSGAVYLVGGYDGSAPQDDVYSTINGRHFRRVAALPVGLRYSAVATAGDSVIVAGGLSKTGTVSTVYEFHPGGHGIRLVGRLPRPVAHAAAISLGGKVYVIGGRDDSGRALSSISRIDPRSRTVRAMTPLSRPVADAAVAPMGSDAWLLGGWRGTAVTQILRASLIPRGTGQRNSSEGSTAGGSSNVRPFAGKLLIADRGNNRLLVVNRWGEVVCQYPRPGSPPPRERFYFPDDAFWADGGHAILVNEEGNDQLVEIGYPSGRVLWSYGHPGVPGSDNGYLSQPDDLYPLPGGGLVVADARNCRILFFGPSGHPIGQIGTTGVCARDLPRAVGYPNGDTPIGRNRLFITELNGGYVDEVTRKGEVVWSFQVPGVPVPSDPQLLSDGSYLVAD